MVIGIENKRPHLGRNSFRHPYNVLRKGIVILDRLVFLTDKYGSELPYEGIYELTISITSIAPAYRRFKRRLISSPDESLSERVKREDEDFELSSDFVGEAKGGCFFTFSTSRWWVIFTTYKFPNRRQTCSCLSVMSSLGTVTDMSTGASTSTGFPFSKKLLLVLPELIIALEHDDRLGCPHSSSANLLTWISGWVQHSKLARETLFIGTSCSILVDAISVKRKKAILTPAFAAKKPLSNTSARASSIPCIVACFNAMLSKFLSSIVTSDSSFARAENKAWSGSGPLHFSATDAWLDGPQVWRFCTFHFERWYKTFFLEKKKYIFKNVGSGYQHGVRHWAA